MLYLVHTNNGNDNKDENKALRLKDDIGRDISAPLSSLGSHDLITGTGDDVSDHSGPGGVRWQYFSEAGYIAGDSLRGGEDKYARNKFNQEASDKIPSNRDVPDTRSKACRAQSWSEKAASLPPTSV